MDFFDSWYDMLYFLNRKFELSLCGRIQTAVLKDMSGGGGGGELLV